MIVRVSLEEELEAARRLFREYEAGLGVNLDFQGFESEVASLPGRYAAPDGALLLARGEEGITGCGALRRLGDAGDGLCEMKRLYVRPEGRGRGVGRMLAEELIREAVRLGYETMVLDTLDRLKAAISLYESLGFVRTEPYYENPLPGVIYWRLRLDVAGGA